MVNVKEKGHGGLTVVDMETEKDLNLKWTRAKMGEAIKTGGYQQVAGLIF